MSDRKNILDQVLTLSSPLKKSLAELSQFNWDTNKPIAFLELKQCEAILQRLIEGEITISEVEDWANIIESRDDIGYERNYEEILNTLIFELANPLLTQVLTPQRAVELRKNLQELSSTQ